MPFSIHDVELTAPLPTIETAEGETGVALVLRRRGRPVGFAMRDLPPRARLSPAALGDLVMAEAQVELLAETLREERATDRRVRVDPSPAGPRTSPAIASLSIAICTHDRPELLERCVRSLTALEESPGLEVEVIVVDNAPSDDRVLERVRDFPAIRYVREPKPGLDFARNRALREAEGEFIAYLDDDTVVDAGWLRGLLEALEEHPDAVGVTGLVLPWTLATDSQILFEKRGGFRRGFRKRRFCGRVMPGLEWYPCGAGHFGIGANMAFRRATILEMGGFDEALDAVAPHQGGGDLDMFYRVVRAGHPLVYEPSFLVFHEHRRTRRELRGQYGSWGSGHMAFLMKSYDWDREQRGRHRAVLLWWLQDQLSRLQRSIRGRELLPPDLVAAEFWGGIVGLFGHYGRATRRMRRIVERHS